jgi:hypothetical protein
MTSQLRFQVSTMLICVGFLLLPWASTLLDIPKLPMEWSGFQHVLDVFILDVGPQLFLVAFVVAFIFLVKAVWRRQWVSAIQAFGEMSACIVSIMLVPAY